MVVEFPIIGNMHKELFDMDSVKEIPLGGKRHLPMTGSFQCRQNKGLSPH
jgi:hypothetical protein